MRSPWNTVRPAVVSLTIGGLILFALYVVSLFLWPPQHGAFRKSLTMSHLKQVSLSTAIYLEDFGDRYPPDMSSARGAIPFLKSYLKDSRLILSMNPNSGEFLGNGSLAKVEYESIKEPQHVLEFFDSAPWPTGRRVIVYADTHCRNAPESDFQHAVRNGYFLELVKK